MSLDRLLHRNGGAESPEVFVQGGWCNLEPLCNFCDGKLPILQQRLRDMDILLAKRTRTPADASSGASSDKPGCRSFANDGAFMRSTNCAVEIGLPSGLQKVVAVMDWIWRSLPSASLILIFAGLGRGSSIRTDGSLQPASFILSRSLGLVNSDMQPSSHPDRLLVPFPEIV